MCQPCLHTERNWADNITGMSSMENERNRLQWKTLPSTRVERRTMCCQRYVILHATRHSARTHLRVHDCRCKNTQTPATRLFGFLHNEVWWWMELVRIYRTSKIHHAGLPGWLLITVVPLPRQKEALPCLCLLCRDTWWYLPTNRQRNGKSERLDLVVHLFLALISVWPLAVLSVFVMPFVRSFSFRRKVVALRFPRDVIFGVKKKNDMKAEPQLRTLDA